MEDNARVFDHLMTGVLGYSSYMAEVYADDSGFKVAFTAVDGWDLLPGTKCCI